MTVGVIYCAFATPDLIEKSLNPWVNYNDGINKIIISATSCPFLGFPEQDNTETLQILKKYEESCKIDSVFTSDKPITEIEARNKSLFRLIDLHFKNKDITSVILVDSDEIWNNEEISNLFKFLESEKNSNNYWHRINYRNLIFDGTQYYSGFDPARVYWVEKNRLHLDSFLCDNYCNYYYEEHIIDCRKLNNCHVPENLVNPFHESWTNSERSRKKVKYQVEHFGNGDANACSFKWNEERKCLEFNLDYYHKYNKQIPVLKDLIY